MNEINETSIKNGKADMKIVRQRCIENQSRRSNRPLEIPERKMEEIIE